MDANELYGLITTLELRIAELPIGYISRKTINGKTHCYHQWTENGKLKSKYIKEGELEPLEAGIQKRRVLQEQVKKLRAGLPKLKGTVVEYECSVTIGKALSELSAPTSCWERRDSFETLRQYLYGSETDRVLILFGLRRTGKTTMLRQAVAEMTVEDQGKAAYIKLRQTDTMDMLNRDLKRLHSAGYRYVFLDEVTLMKDFIDSAALLSDVFAAMGMKLVLSGTDSLGFWLTLEQELYDRAYLIHTTFIPFREYSRLLGIDSIDTYIRCGGTLRAGETAFGDSELTAEDISFRDDESTRRYIDTAICKNIQHSLACCGSGGDFRHLYALYEAGELTNAINRIVESMNQKFVLEVLTRDFKSGDLGLAARNLRKDRDPQRRTDILDIVDQEAVTKRLMDLLEIRNSGELSVDIRPEHVVEIKQYLKALELILDCPTEFAEAGLPPEEHVLFTQPGMRYCQAEALVYSLLQDETFQLLSERRKRDITERVLEEVRGRMMEDIVLLETARALGHRYKVFKLRFERGEYDMVVYDRESDQCAAYEIKHSREAVPEQARHLLDEEKRALAEQRFGPMVSRNVIYRGEDMAAENGITYHNVERFLKQLPEFTFTQTPEQVTVDTQDSSEPDFHMTM